MSALRNYKAGVLGLFMALAVSTTVSAQENGTIIDRLGAVDGTQALIAAVLIVDESMTNEFSIAEALTTLDNVVLLAPTNSAFEAFLGLEAGFLKGLSVDDVKAALPSVLDGLGLTAADVSNVLTFHVGQTEAASSEELLAAKQVTVAGSTMPLAVSLGNKGVQINYQSSVIKADVTASNGVIHYIDTVITP
ncbi:MAG: fasciclin domain-containing protein [Pseudohongiellaceae bacterium]